MNSFRRKLVRPYINGTKTSPQTGQVITGSGNPALDEILGGGIPMNSLILIEEDKHGVYSKVLCKYFLAEGVLQKQQIFLASLDENPAEIFKKLPEPVFPSTVLDNSADFDQLSMDTTSLRIAWRYNDLPYLNVGVEYKENHQFNLLQHMTEHYVANVSKVLWNGTVVDENASEHSTNEAAEEEEEDDDDEDESSSSPTTASLFTNKLFQRLVDALAKQLRLLDFSRICIQSLGSPLWYKENFGEDLLKFLTIVRAMVQNSTCACFLTMPMHLIAKEDETLVPKIRNLVDFSLELDSFAGSHRETNPAFKDYNGLVHLKKMSAINSIALFQHSDLAFKLRRKKFVIEKFHLPPELEETSDQDPEDIVPKPTPATCATNTGTSKLDF